MPGPPKAGPARAVAARGALAGLVVLALVAAVAVAALALRHDPSRATAESARSAAQRAATLKLIPTPGTTGAATCSDPVARQEWRVTWRAITTPAPNAVVPTAGAATAKAEPADRAAAITLTPTGFAVRPLPAATSAPTTASGAPTRAATTGPGRTGPTGWQARNDDRWQLRWSPTLAETMSAAPGEEWVRTGPLATLAGVPRSVRQNPRFVTPDGACSVYLAPFVSGTTGGRNTVAVVGDSLVAQLYASENATATGTGWLQNRLLAAGSRAEIAGQGGRRWTIRPNVGSGLDQADSSMLDEIRGLRAARSVVVALGTNDAGWVALAGNQEQYELRLAWVLLHLAPILDELRDHGHCTVVTTMAARNKNYVNSAPGRFDAAATRINDYLRERADADPNDRLKLWDWGGHADGHGTSDPQPWFGADTIHLNPAGLARYADELAAAAALC